MKRVEENEFTVSFDWYRATGHFDHGVVEQAFIQFGYRSVHGKPHFKGYQFGASIRDGDDEIGSLAWGGKNAARPLFEVHGEHTMSVVTELRAVCPVHKPCRIDVAIDFLHPSFDEILGDVLAIKKKYKLYGQRGGDWEDFPELGRSYYLEKRKRPGVMARLYQKGLYEEWLHVGLPTWSRLEFEIYPDSHNAHLYASATPIQALAARRWAADLAGRVLKRDIARLPVVKKKADKTPMETLEWIGENYWRTLVACRQSLSSWEEVGVLLGRHAAASNDEYFSRHTNGG
jgi:hypothetical protein